MERLIEGSHEPQKRAQCDRRLLRDLVVTELLSRVSILLKAANRDRQHWV